MESAHKTQFQERLQRIAAGGPNTMSQVYVGPPETSRSARGGKVSGGPDILDSVLYPMSIIGAFMVGVFAVVLTRFIRFHMMGGELTGENADIWMIFDSILAIGIVISLRSVFRSGGKALEMAKAVGVVFMLLGMHNIVHLAPGLFGSVFSPQWTSQVIAGTEPGSILFRGVSYGMGDPQKPVAQTLQIIEYD